MEEKLQELFPEFDLIRDTELRKSTLACWTEAMERGGWVPADLDNLPFTLLIPGCTVSFRRHVRAVTRTAIAAAELFKKYYGEAIKIDMDMLVAGGLLHDIGKLSEYRYDGDRVVKSATGKLLRHPFSGAGLAMKHGLPDGVVHIIATHAREGDGGYRTPEANIVHYADFMNFESVKSAAMSGD
jgi:putative nucleotidyltransferase with HDIG domain